MKLNLQDTVVKDFQSLFKGQPNKIENLEISFSKVNFLQEQGFNQLIQHLSIYENTKQITLTLKEQKISQDEIQSLSLVIKKLKKLLVIQISFEDQELSADEYKVLLDSISENPFLKQAYITCAQKELGSQECQAIQNCVIKSKSLNKLKLKQGMGLIQYGIILSPNDKDVQIAVEKISLSSNKELILLISPLISLKKIEKISLDITDVKINQCQIDLNEIVNCLKEVDLFQVQNIQKKQKNQIEEKEQQHFKYFEYLEIQSKGQYYIIKQVQPQISKPQQILIENQFVKTGLNLSPLAQFQSVESLILKITCGQLNIEKSIAQNLLSEIEKVQQLDLELISIDETNEMKLLLQQIAKLSKLNQIKINFKLDKDLLKFDMFNFFVENIASNQNVQEIYINFFDLKNLINFQEIAQKLKDMVGLKKLKLEYKIQQQSNKSLVPETQVILKEFDINELKSAQEKS
ncbi:hypothetical protein ABPG74_004875 [Tetrahymena malaccensis]